MQTNYFRGPQLAVGPGQLYDISSVHSGDIISVLAGTAIPPGVLCELSAGVLQPVQDTHANWPPAGTTGANSLVGISVYDLTGSEQGLPTVPIPASTVGSTFTGYAKGQYVPVLTRGRIWMQCDNGGTALALGPVNVWHSSDGSHAQGVATFSATATTAGAEIDAMGAYLTSFDLDGLGASSFSNEFGDTVIVLAVNINLPGHA